jgi:hypothetical protein
MVSASKYARENPEILARTQRKSPKISIKIIIDLAVEIKEKLLVVKTFQSFKN